MFYSFDYAYHFRNFNHDIFYKDLISQYIIFSFIRSIYFLLNFTFLPINYGSFFAIFNTLFFLCMFLKLYVNKFWILFFGCTGYFYYYYYYYYYYLRLHEHWLKKNIT